MLRLLAIMALVTSSANTCFAGEEKLSEGLSYFGGVFSYTDFPGDANIPFGGELEYNYIVGGIYHREYFALGAGFYSGAEVGLSVRFGDGEPTSGEIFGGATIRHRGVDIGPVNIAPRMTFGLSAVTDTIGVATRRARVAGTNGTLLFYLGPELSLSFKQIPKTEFFYRTHHRSGANGILSNMGGGHNAHAFGVRRNF